MIKTICKAPYSSIHILFLFIFTLAFLNGCSETSDQSSQHTDETPPNIVLIFLDDAGYADFNPYAETRYPTPNVQTLAEEGRKFMNFYVPQAICSASRAALMTGTYPERNGLFNAHPPKDRGLNPDFMTMGEMLQNNGYTTGFFGKWHLGDQEETRPHNRGFNETAGIMYSNDMWSGHPENPEYWGQFPMYYWKNGEVVIDSVTAEHQKNFTTWFTEESVDFINRNSDGPFFLYVPHPQPHVPLFVSEKFEGKSGTGLYGDVMMEIDWSVGEIMNALDENGVRDNTMILFSSDNGPWLSYANHSGKTIFREGKGTSFDGGIRSPMIISYPNGIEKNSVSHSTFFSIDLMPTIAALTGSELPDYEIDGKNVLDLLHGPEESVSPQEYYAFTNGTEFQGVMSGDGKWKLHLPHGYRTSPVGGRDGLPGLYQQARIDTVLFDMVHDPFEKVNVIDDYPEIAEELIRIADEHRAKFFE
ncbi:MAG: sulfatase-like hydrolase/transferase [Bacteroidetes bacterium]|jgi:arylsulfatase A-like enzyme|nr:sulfatase-like hydrolase/transferase [Bacteroidota bacterium]